MTPSDSAAAIIAEYASPSSVGFLYSDLSVAVLFVYDIILTIGLESKYFWGNRLSGAAALFYLNRFLTIMFYVLYISVYAIPPESARSCAILVKTVEVVQLLLYLCPGAFTALRMFALSQSWVLTVLVFVLAVFPTIGLNLATFGFGLTGVELPMIRCTIVDALSVELTKLFAIISRTSLIAADCLAILVIWLKLSSQNTPGGPDKHADFRPYGLNKSSPYTHVLLRDGIFYFAIIGGLNCFQLISTLLSVGSLQNANFISQFTEPLNAVLVSRCLLHLQSIKYGTSDTSFSQLSSIRFEHIIDSFDTSLLPEDSLDDPGDATNPTTTLGGIEHVTVHCNGSSPSPEFKLVNVGGGAGGVGLRSAPQTAPQ